MTNTDKVDFPALAGELKGTLLDALKGLVSGATDDVKTFAQSLANNLATALSQGDSQLTEELKEQALVIAEINRVRATRAKWEVFYKTLDVAARAASAGLNAGLGALNKA